MAYSPRLWLMARDWLVMSGWLPGAMQAQQLSS